MHQEWYRFLFGLLATTLGLLLGLLINSLVNHARNRRAHLAMLEAIKSEARANKAILDESFKPYFQEGIVLRDLSVGTVSQYLANSLFVQYSTPLCIEILNVYLRNIRLANAYRVRAERTQVSQEGKQFLDSILQNWGNNIKQCDSNIEEVIQLKR